MIVFTINRTNTTTKTHDGSIKNDRVALDANGKLLATISLYFNQKQSYHSDLLVTVCHMDGTSDNCFDEDEAISDIIAKKMGR